MSFRRWLSAQVRGLIAGLLDRTGVLALLRRRRAARGEVPVLMLHRVAGRVDAPEPDALPADLFASLVREVAQRYELASWDAAARCARGAPPAGARPLLVLSADDGYADQARTLWSLVSAAGGSAVFFVSAGPLATGQAFWWDTVAAHAVAAGDEAPTLDRSGHLRHGPGAQAQIALWKRAGASALAAHLEQLGAGGPAPRALAPLTHEEMLRLAAEGAHIGGHGVSHATLTACDDAELAAEALGSAALLAALPRQGPALFAYPSGGVDERVARAVRAAGFEFAFTTERGVFGPGVDPLRIPRIEVSPAMCSLRGAFSWSLFEAELLGVFDVLR